MKMRTCGILLLVIAAVLFLLPNIPLAMFNLICGLGILLFGKEKPKNTSNGQPQQNNKNPQPQPTPYQKPAPHQHPTPRQQTIPRQQPVPYQPSVPQQQSPIAADAYTYRGSVEDYFLEVLQRAFPDYHIHQNPRTSDTEHLTILLHQNGGLKAVLILCDKNKFDTQQIRDTMDSCMMTGVPCLRFMREFRNDANYVTQRIRKALG